MNPQEKLAALLKQMSAIVAGAKASARSLSDDEIKDLEAKNDEAVQLKAAIARSAKADALLESIGALGADAESAQDNTPASSAKSLGEHFIKHLGNRSLKNPGTIETPEFKAASDTQVSGGHTGAYGPLLTEVDRNFVLPVRERLVVEDILGRGSVSGTAITYPVFGALEGGTEFKGETDPISQLHVGDPTWRTDALGEVAGYFKLTEDMAEDLDYVVSEINSTAIYDLESRSEAAILSGPGTGVHLLGIRNRSGVQTHAQGGDTVADAIFKGMRRVQTGSGFAADGLLINPVDYEGLRLNKDGNGQYYGGGYFQGQYGQGGFVEVPPVWGLRTIVSLAAPQGEPLVGAYRAAAKVFRKGGLRVTSTNSHEDDFTHERITVKVKRRLGLQVKYPAAFVKVALGVAE